jgi:uncharacterized protein YaiL (DUF2058 family)
MNSSLRDQLLAAGLVTEKQARQAAQQEQQRQNFRNHHAGKSQQSRSRGGAPQSGAPRSGGPGQSQGQPRSGQQGQPPGQGQPRQQIASQHPGAQQQPEAKAFAQQAVAAKAARDKELNRRREDKAQRRARIAQIEQIVEQHRLPRLETEDYYSFIDGKKIRRMSVDAARREQLTNQTLRIVRYKGHYAVVPAETAERIRERDANMVVPYVEPPKAPEVDEAYKDFVVPDDLMW